MAPGLTTSSLILKRGRLGPAGRLEALDQGLDAGAVEAVGDQHRIGGLDHDDILDPGAGHQPAVGAHQDVAAVF